ncbi:MAG: VTT domain-containing protein [Thermoplasmata archaeon]|nr:VTT domain-containing protein [Thermoplasmata archaeon]
MTTIPEMMDQLIDYLSANQADPVTYLLVFYIVCVAAAIILPIPVEIALAANPSIHIAVKAAVMGLGKGTGALAVYFFGRKIDETVGQYARRWRWYNWLLVKSEKLVRKYGYFAMYAIMSTPGMVDTIPLYIFSILNKEGELMTLKWFVLVNILAGVTRAFLIYGLFKVFGIELFG